MESFEQKLKRPLRIWRQCFNYCPFSWLIIPTVDVPWLCWLLLCVSSAINVWLGTVTQFLLTESSGTCVGMKSSSTHRMSSYCSSLELNKWHWGTIYYSLLTLSSLYYSLTLSFNPSCSFFLSFSVSLSFIPYSSLCLLFAVYHSWALLRRCEFSHSLVFSLAD